MLSAAPGVDGKQLGARDAAGSEAADARRDRGARGVAGAEALLPGEGQGASAREGLRHAKTMGKGRKTGVAPPEMGRGAIEKWCLEAAVHVSLGVLTVQSRPPFTTETGEVTVQLHPSSEPVLAVVTRQGVKTPMISTLWWALRGHWPTVLESEGKSGPFESRFARIYMVFCMVFRCCLQCFRAGKT